MRSGGMQKAIASSTERSCIETDASGSETAVLAENPSLLLDRWRFSGMHVGAGGSSQEPDWCIGRRFR